MKFPVDTSSFKSIREEGYIYVDKTKFVDMLSKTGTYYFLARPRRFGKSMFLKTLESYFKNERHLFKGLAIDSLQPEEWQKYPVLSLNLTGKVYSEPDNLINTLEEWIRKYEERYGIDNNIKDIDDRFYFLINQIYHLTSKKVVVLIDEYDAPLTETIDNPTLQESYRGILRGFYSVLKKADDIIRFCMLTGVTRYGKVSIFSGLNNLNDISFNNKYASICGITEGELKTYYDDGVSRLAEIKGETVEKSYAILKHYYDGYHFSENMIDIYNPYSINHALDACALKDYWCASGAPGIFIKQFMQTDYNIESLQGREVSETELSNLSVYLTDPAPLLYQTGYLTLKSYNSEDELYTLGYPNREVEKGLLNNVLSVYSPQKDTTTSIITSLKRSLLEGNPEMFVKYLRSYLAGIPHQLRENVARYENYYHTIIYCVLDLLGLSTNAEFSTAEGFIDLLVKTEKYIYVIELKINGTAKDAIKQIEERHYCRPFENDKRQMFKIGLGFSKETNTIETSIIE